MTVNAASNCIRRSPDRPSGITFVELMVVALIMGVLLSMFAVSLKTGDLIYNANSAAIDAQADARMIMDWVTRDVRQAISWDISSTGNDPGPGHLKFRTGSFNTTTEAWDLDGGFIEYEYDQTDSVLYRRMLDAGGAVLSESGFPHIVVPPFYTAYTDETVNDFNVTRLSADRTLVVVISESRQTRMQDANFTLIGEVRIRNGG